jgi:hypothetical protein
MGYNATGTIVAILDTQQVTERFRKREFVLEIRDGNYPQTVIFQLTGDRCESLDGFSRGNIVDVEFSLRGREWTSPKGEVRYFNSLDVWTVNHVAGSVDSEPIAEPAHVDDGPPPVNDQLDEIPF